MTDYDIDTEEPQSRTISWPVIAALTIVFGPALLAPPWGLIEGGPHAGLTWWQIPFAWLGLFLWVSALVAGGTWIVDMMPQFGAGGVIHA